jgi:methionyl-tRNA formyltransferase
MKYNFNKVRNLLFLGGGPIMAQLIKEQSFFSVIVITAERFLNEVVLEEGVTFKELLIQKKIHYIVSEDINIDMGVNKYITHDTVGLSISAPWIIKQEFIDKFLDGKLINLHTSLLPKYRGGGGPTWKILNGENKGAYTVHFITTGIDDGDVIAHDEFRYPENCKYPEQWNRIDVKMCVKGVLSILKTIHLGNDFERIKQDQNVSVYFPRLNSKFQGYIDWKWSAIEIVSFIHAFSFPFEGAKTFIDNRLIKIRLATVGVKEYFHPFMHGLVIRKNRNEIAIAGLNYEILITDVVDEYGNTIFNKIRLGDRLYTPLSVLEEAFIYRAQYGSKGLITKK